jgi:hypothetical protein
MLEAELQYFAENLPQWLEKHADRVALIKGQELIGLFDNEQEAIAEGARKYGLDSFLVRRITAHQPEFTAPALTLGILRADHPSSSYSTGNRS